MGRHPWPGVGSFFGYQTLLHGLAQGIASDFEDRVDHGSHVIEGMQEGPCLINKKRQTPK